MQDQHGDGVRLCIGGLVGVYSGLVQLYSMAYQYWPACVGVLLQLKYVFSQTSIADTGTLCAWDVVPLAGKYR